MRKMVHKIRNFIPDNTEQHVDAANEKVWLLP